MTIGTGVVHELVVEHADEVDSESLIEDQWKHWDAILANDAAVDPLARKVPGYVAYVQTTKFSWFQCPDCKKLI
jgi:hypothetical protein